VATSHFCEQTLILGCSKNHCVFSNRWRCPRLFVCERDMNECQMFTPVLLLTLNLKTKKKIDAIRSSLVLAIVIRTWRILKSIFAIFCFITSKKGRKQLKQGKSCVEFTAEMSSKNSSAKTGSPDSVMVIFQSKTLIAPVGLPRLKTMK